MVSDPELLEAVREFISPENCPVATSDDVAARVDLQRETVRQRLLRLAADNHLRTRKLGRSRVFWIPDALEAVGSDAPDQERAPAVGVDDAVAMLEPPGLTEEKTDARRDALRQALEALADAHPSGLAKAGVLERVDGYGVFDNGDSLWRNWLYEALSELEDRGAVESPTAEHGWRFTE